MTPGSAAASLHASRWSASLVEEHLAQQESGGLEHASRELMEVGFTAAASEAALQRCGIESTRQTRVSGQVLLPPPLAPSYV